MKLPRNEHAFVAEEKIRDYLLSETHATGKHKAAFFKKLGFDNSRIETFNNTLLQHALEREVSKDEKTPFGHKYELKCDFGSTNICVKTVWIIDDEIPKLITAYPA